MDNSKYRYKGIARQCITGTAVIALIALACYLAGPWMGYRVIALFLLLAVSVMATFFDTIPVLLIAAVSAFTWNYFFIPPRFSLGIDTTEDFILLLMHFLLAMVNTVLMARIRRVEKRARKKEERANTLKLYDTLLSSLSHELRTPIATIIAATDNLQSDQLTDPVSANELVTAISRSAGRLNQQVENLLNMSRLDSGAIKSRPVWYDPAELLYQVVAKVEEDGLSQRINIHVNPDLPMIRGDRFMLEQILYNLLGNARVHTTPDTVIDLSLFIRGKRMEILVEDNGNGFPDEEIENVFDKFHRVGNTQAGGTGLGLSIVKGFAEALHGSVSLENRNGGGARFQVNLPCETSTIRINP